MYNIVCLPIPDLMRADKHALKQRPSTSLFEYVALLENVRETIEAMKLLMKNLFMKLNEFFNI